MNTRILGSTLIAAGTAIGAGMLAFPLVCAAPGFLAAALLFIFVWGVMFISALLTLEVNLAFTAPQNSYLTMAQVTLGKWGRLITAISFASLLYALIAAYITGGGSLFQALLQMGFHWQAPDWFSKVLFTGLLGIFVALGTRSVDLLNRSFFSVKLIFLALIFAFFLPEIQISSLAISPEPDYLWVAAPVILTAFGFHIVIPSLAPYLDNHVKSLKTVLLWAGLLPLMIYLVWLACLLGTVPRTGPFSFAELASGDGSLKSLIFTIEHWRPTAWLNISVNTFANLAMITSFLGVSLSLFDFLKDKKDKIPHPLRTASLTFLPPLFWVIFFPEGFVQLISLASIFVAIILMILPAAMAYQLRRRAYLNSPYRAPGGTPVLIGVFITGVIFIVIECMRLSNNLPIWTP